MWNILALREANNVWSSPVPIFTGIVPAAMGITGQRVPTVKKAVPLPPYRVTVTHQEARLVYFLHSTA